MAIAKSLKSLYNRQLVVDSKVVDQFPNSWTAATAGLVHAKAGKSVEIQTRENPQSGWTPDAAGMAQLQTRLGKVPAVKNSTASPKNSSSKALFELADSARYLAQNIGSVNDEHKQALRESIIAVCRELDIELHFAVLKATAPAATQAPKEPARR